MDRSRHNQTEPWDNGVYGTGKTEPPKNNSGIIALLLIIIIFLSGIVSGLSFMNVRLFQQLQQAQLEQETVPMAFSDLEAEEPLVQNALQDALAEAETLEVPELGLSGSFITAFDRYYFNWPGGFVVSQAEKDGWAGKIGIGHGDIILQINDSPITCPEELDTFLQNTPSGTALRVLIHRDGMEYILTGNK